MDTKARPPKPPQPPEDDEVIVVDPAAPPLDDPHLGEDIFGLDVAEEVEEQEPMEVEVEALVGEDEELEEVEKEVGDEGGDDKEEDEGEHQEKGEEKEVGDEGGDEEKEEEKEVGDEGGDEEKEEKEVGQEVDEDAARGAIRALQQEQARMQTRDPVMHLDLQGVFQVCKLGSFNAVNNQPRHAKTTIDN